MQTQTLSATADLCHPVEQAILADFLGLPRPPEAAGIDLQALAGREIDGVVFLAPAWDQVDRDTLSNAVARILLDRVQDALPQWGAVHGDEVTLGRQPWGRPERRLAILPQFLFGINWASTAPGLSWPEDYHVALIAGYDRYAVTRSLDSSDAWGYTELVIDTFPADRDPVAGAHDVLVSEWRRQRDDWGQERWEWLLAPGLVGSAEAEAWADEVWGAEEEEGTA